VSAARTGGPKLVGNVDLPQLSFEQSLTSDQRRNHNHESRIIDHPFSWEPAAPRKKPCGNKALLEARGLVAYAFFVNKTSLDQVVPQSGSV